MSRRKTIDYDDDYHDDGYYDDYDEEEEEEEAGEEANSQYLYSRSPAGGHGASGSGVDASVDPSQAELLDTLADGLRECLGDETIPADQIDAVLVAADYDIDGAVALLREQRSKQELFVADAPNRLRAAQPSAIARMLDADQDSAELARPDLPLQNQELLIGGDRSGMFSFDEPSPDDLVQQRRSAGKTRAKEISAREPGNAERGNKLRGGVVDIGAGPKPGGSKPAGTREQPAQGSRAIASRLKDVSGVSSPAGKPLTVHRKDKTGQGGSSGTSCRPAPKQRARSVKLLSAKDLAGRFPSVSIVVAGHVDAGKSTLLGHLLRLLGAVSGDPKRPSRPVAGKQRERAGRGSGKGAGSGVELAWVTDEDPVEQERGVTVDIATRIFKGRKSSKTFSIIDAPGHRDYVPAMILGACQAGAAILVVDASTGEFESGFSEEGQTREHAVVLRSLGVSRLVVAINKMDMVDFSQARFVEVRDVLSKFLKTLGWKIDKDVTFVPAAGLPGINLVENPAKNHPLVSWYEGATVLDALEALPCASANEIGKAMERPTRLVVSDAFRSSTLGGVIAVSGRLVSGTIMGKDQLRLCPTTEVATVKSIEVGQKARRGADDVAVAAADILPVSVGLVDVPDTLVISPGDVLCDPEVPVPVASRFRGLVTTIAAPVPLVQGLPVEIHLSGMCEAATISKLVELKTGAKESEKKKRPRRLRKGDLAVIEVTVSRPVCIELASNVKFLGRFALRCHGRTVAAGLVTELLKDRKSQSMKLGMNTKDDDVADAQDRGS